MNTFKTFHPLVNFTYFISVILGAMFFMHPLCLIISLSGSCMYAIKLRGWRKFGKNAVYMLPVLIGTAMINPLFNHEGMTILTYFKSGNPLTLESIVYGLAAATMLVTVFSWFSCYNVVMSSDKFIYLFGKIMPSFSLLLTMVMRFVPKFKEQIKKIANAQQCIGRDIGTGNIIERVRHGIHILSIMVTWALEDAVETADSMKSRGYGLKGRTAYSNYQFGRKDLKVLCANLFLNVYVMAGYLLGKTAFHYFPRLTFSKISLLDISFFSAYLLLCHMPRYIERWEEHQWKTIQSNN